MLWEIGRDGIEVRILRRRLGLDSANVSRLLRSLAAQRLVELRTGEDDRGLRAHLTKRGLAERSHLDRRSDALAGDLLQRLDDRQRQLLVESMAAVERLLRASMIRFVVAEPTSIDARWCLDQYFRELDARFDGGFDPGRSNPADAGEIRRPRGLLLLAYDRERPIGCGALKFHRAAPAELKRMWIDPDARGLRLGARLLAELERQAFDAGVRVVRLETNKALAEAIALYRKAGYAEVRPFNHERYAHHWFEKSLTGQSNGAR
jgi:DNA-binding MarR family transcriptional regulator/GNAT superfamily N-acetyltransferase